MLKRPMEQIELAEADGGNWYDYLIHYLPEDVQEQYIDSQQIERMKKNEFSSRK